MSDKHNFCGSTLQFAQFIWKGASLSVGGVLSNTCESENNFLNIGRAYVFKLDSIRIDFEFDLNCKFRKI